MHTLFSVTYPAIFALCLIRRQIKYLLFMLTLLTLTSSLQRTLLFQNPTCISTILPYTQPEVVLFRRQEKPFVERISGTSIKVFQINSQFIVTLAC